MINEYELRKGNCFLVDGDVKKVVHLEEDVIEIDSYRTEIDLKVAKFVSYEDAEPIPLTPEVLGKCGFVIKGGFHFPVSGSIHLPPLYNSSDGYFLSDDRINGIHYKYLHQLQNLYFALTGTELTYTP